MDEGGVRQGRKLRRIAFGLAVAYVAVGALFIAGETFTDPGGLTAVGLTALWLVPLLGLGWLGLSRPALAAGPLAAITGVVVALSIVAAASGGHWSAFEDRHGPVRAIVVFVLCGVLAAFGYRRPVQGGLLLLAGAVLPALLSVLTGGPGTAAIPIVALPGAVLGVLYLFSARSPAPKTGTPAPKTRTPAHGRREEP